MSTMEIFVLHNGRLFIFGINGYWQASKVTIDSKLPLHIKVND